MSESILLSVDAGVATLSFNRPHVFNAMDAEMMIQFRTAAERVQRDAGVRALVLRGEGKAFISGGDVALFHQHIEQLPEAIVRWGRDASAISWTGTTPGAGLHTDLFLG